MHLQFLDYAVVIFYGVFLLAGSLQPNLGGGIVAHNTSLPDLQSRVNNDPFVVENVVDAEILEITPSKADVRLNFLLGLRSINEPTLG